MPDWASWRRMRDNTASCSALAPTPMKRPCAIFFAMLISGVMLAGPVLACDYPRSPALPNGETATQDEMFAAQQAVRSYVASAEAYLACLEAVEANPENPITPKQAEINVKRYNAMVEEMHRVSDEYNVAVRIFKARQ